MSKPYGETWESNNIHPVPHKSLWQNWAQLVHNLLYKPLFSGQYFSVHSSELCFLLNLHTLRDKEACWRLIVTLGYYVPSLVNLGGRVGKGNHWYLILAGNIGMVA